MPDFRAMQALQLLSFDNSFKKRFNSKTVVY